MSQTFKHGATTFVCNSDLSGEIKIVRDYGDYEGRKELEVYGEDLLAFVVGFLKVRAKANIDNLSQKEFLATLGLQLS